MQATLALLSGAHAYVAPVRMALSQQPLMWAPPPFRSEWECVSDAKNPILKKYFDAEMDTLYSLDVFCVEGVPAAAMIYCEVWQKAFVHEFHLNKGLLMLYDAGPQMRTQLFDRHRNLVTERARNEVCFWAI